jgi:predicted lipoprotein with Yx(FWY)xxD motif
VANAGADSARRDQLVVKLSRIALLASGGVAAALALAACGSGAAPAAAPASAPAAVSSAPAPSAATARGSALDSTQSANLGPIVTNGQGRTLYRFDADSTNPPASHCTGQCATAWPPVLGDPASVSLAGVDKSLVGTVTRADGSKQLTLAGSPLYTYAGDQATGQTNGQGVEGTWWAITPQGAKAASAGGAAPTTAAAGGSGGYTYGGY